MGYPMTAVVATRTFVWTHRNKKTSPVQVLIGTPMPRHVIDRGIDDWYCPYQIVGAGDDSVHVAFGADALQALVVALELSGAYVKASPAAAAGELDWTDVPNYGFPEIQPVP